MSNSARKRLGLALSLSLSLEIPHAARRPPEGRSGLSHETRIQISLLSRCSVEAACAPVESATLAAQLLNNIASEATIGGQDRGGEAGAVAREERGLVIVLGIVLRGLFFVTGQVLRGPLLASAALEVLRGPLERVLQSPSLMVSLEAIYGLKSIVNSQEEMQGGSILANCIFQNYTFPNYICANYSFTGLQFYKIASLFFR